MTPQRRQMSIEKDVNLINSSGCGIVARHLKSWASVKRACQFKSGPGQFSLFSQLLTSLQSIPRSCLKKSQKEPFGVPSDATMTPLRGAS